MTNAIRKMSRLEFLLAGLLHYGTALASAVIGLGLIRSSAVVVASGVLILILLPVARVVLMLIFFVKARDHRFVIITATVLLIIITSCAVGFGIGKNHLLPKEKARLVAPASL